MHQHMHAGVVITKDPVNTYVPLYLNDNNVVTQYTMTTLEELGLLKMDFLGLRTLTVIRECEDIVKKYGENYVEKKEIVDRIKYELDVIIKMGYTDYFLIVWDFITYAKSQKIPVGPRKRFWSRINCCICVRYNRY